MNDVIDSRLDALVFDYVNFGIFTVVNNLWTFIAVLTAAVSFWRIRAVAGAVPSSSSKQESITRTTTTTSLCYESRLVPETSVSQSATEPEPEPSTSKSTSPAHSSVFEVNGVTKGNKFVVYYEDDGEGGCDGNGDGEGDLTAVGERGVDDGWWEGWEGVLRMRMEGDGWYRYQDLTAIDGNVVRLWDGVGRNERQTVKTVPL